MASDDKKGTGDPKAGDPKATAGRKPVTLDLAAEKRSDSTGGSSATSTPKTGTPKADEPKAGGAGPAASGGKPDNPKAGGAETSTGAATSPGGPGTQGGDAKPAATGPASTKLAVDKPKETSTIPSAFATGSGSRAAPTSAPIARSGSSFGSLLAAAIIGGVIGAALLWALGAAGLGGDADDPRIAEMQSSIEGLRADIASADGAGLADQVSALQSEVASLSSGPDVDSLRQRLDQLEAAPAGGEGDALSGEIAAMQERVAELSSRLESLAAAPAGESEAVDLSPVTSRVDSLEDRVASLEEQPNELPDSAETRIATLEQRVEEIAGATGTVSENADAVEALRADLDETRSLADRVPALTETFAASALADALSAGQGFDAELQAARAAGLADPALESLAGYSASGVPSIATLRSRFESEVVPALTPPVPELVPEGGGPAEAAGSAFDRILSSARGLVEVRPAAPSGAAMSEESASAAERIRSLLDAGDLASALSEWRGLPEEAKAASESWAEDAEARLAAGDLAGRLRSDSLTRLVPKS